MNRLEALETLKQFSRMQPRYTEWRSKRIKATADGNGTDVATEWSAMLDSVARTLSTIELTEADAVLRRMESGKTTIPPYGELPLTLLRESKIARQGPTQNQNNQPKYRCLDCLDTGITNVWNPNFVEDFRDDFLKISRTEFDRTKTGKGVFGLDRFDPDQTIAAWSYDPPNWEHAAAAWWRHQVDDGGPIHHVALCNCDCRRQQMLASELASYQSRDRRSKDGSQAGPPACGLASYDPKTMPRKTPMSFDDLHAWYGKHAVNEIYEWQA